MKSILLLIHDDEGQEARYQAALDVARTVEGHRLKILEKMNVKNTVGLVVYAIKNGIVRT